MDKETAQKLANWLTGIPRRDYEDVRVVEVSIGTEIFFGVALTEVMKYTAQMTACVRGHVPVGTPYEKEIAWLLGLPPKSYRRHRRTCYPFRGEDWYVAGYVDITGPNEFLPCGPMFALCPWRNAGVIDQFEVRPYTRVAMRME